MAKKSKIHAIVAMSENRVIGARGAIPWRLSGEQRRFAELTSGDAVLMGRKTYESLPVKARPLPGRLNIVISSSPRAAELSSGVVCSSSLQSCMELFSSGVLTFGKGILWIIGGEEIYRQTFIYCDELFLTRVKGVYDGDAYFPEFESEFVLKNVEDFPDRAYEHYLRRR